MNKHTPGPYDVLKDLAARIEECRSCGGTGQLSIDCNDACRNCGGTGRTLDATPLIQDIEDALAKVTGGARRSQTLHTKRQRDRAQALAKSILFHLDRAIKEGERLQEVYRRADDFDTFDSLAYYAGQLEETRECDNGEAGLRPFLRELLTALRKIRT